MTKIAGLCLLGLGLLIYAGTVLRVPLAESTRLDLPPGPDAEEYFAGAMSLYRHHTFVVEVAGHQLGPRYPFGFSLLMVPFLAAGVTPVTVTVPYVVNGVLGLALILGLFAVLWRHGRPLAAGLAAVLLASWPSFIILCRSPLSELSAGVIVLLSCWGFVAFATGAGLRYGLVASFLLGVSVWFRIANIFFVPLLILAPLALRADAFTRARAAVWFGGSYVAGLSPLLWYDWRHFGSVFRTGYAYWVPYWTNLHNGFDPSHVWANASYWWADLVGLPHEGMVAGLFGTGSYFSVGLVGLIAVTAAVRLRRPAELAVAAALALNVTALLFYFYKDARLLFSTVLVCIPFVAREAAELLRACRRHVGSLALATLATVLIVSAVAGSPRRQGGSELWDLLHVSSFRGNSLHYGLVTRLDRMADKPALVFSTINPVYVTALTTVPHIVIPLSVHHQPFRTPLLVDEAETHRLLREALAAGHSVYQLSARHREGEKVWQAPTLPGYEWRTVYAADDVTRVDRLERRIGDVKESQRRP